MPIIRRERRTCAPETCLDGPRAPARTRPPRGPARPDLPRRAEPSGPRPRGREPRGRRRRARGRGGRAAVAERRSDGRRPARREGSSDPSRGARGTRSRRTGSRGSAATRRGRARVRRSSPSWRSQVMAERGLVVGQVAEARPVLAEPVAERRSAVGDQRGPQLHAADAPRLRGDVPEGDPSRELARSRSGTADWRCSGQGACAALARPPAAPRP